VSRRALSILIIIASTVVLPSMMAFQNGWNRHAKFEPIFMARTEMENSTALLGPRTIESPGKIWVYGNYILVIEQFRGVHIVDNIDQNNPQNIAFIRVDGCTDVAVNNDIIYANNAVDMIGIQVNSTLDNIEVISRNRNALPPLQSPEPWGDWYFVEQIPDGMIIVQWIQLLN
jgi:hypothetical protein